MQLFRHLDRSRFEPRLYCLNGAGELIDQVRALGVEVFRPGDGIRRGGE